jgi:hypothetical protein
LNAKRFFRSAGAGREARQTRWQVRLLGKAGQVGKGDAAVAPSARPASSVLGDTPQRAKPGQLDKPKELLHNLVSLLLTQQTQQAGKAVSSRSNAVQAVPDLKQYRCGGLESGSPVTTLFNNLTADKCGRLE